MQLEEQIYTELTAGSPRTDAEDRVYPSLAPADAAFPRITITRVSTEPQNSLSGHSRLDRVTMQFDCWARTRSAAGTLARQVRDLFSASAALKSLPSSETSGFEVESKTFRHTLEIVFWDKTF